MVAFLAEKVGKDFISTVYSINEVDVKELEVARQKEKLDVFSSLKGSAKCQVILFCPDSDMRASPRLCTCDQCMVSCGSCSLFKSYSLEMTSLNKISTRSQYLGPDSDHSDDDSDTGDCDENGDNEIGNCDDFLVANTICAVAAGDSTTDTIWFFKILDEIISTDDYITDDYRHIVHTGQGYFEGYFLEEVNSNSKGRNFKLVPKIAFVFRKSIVYPLVQFEERKDKLFITIQDYVEILYYIEEKGLASL